MSTDFSSVRQTSTDYLERFGEDLLAALLYPFQSVLRAILALILAGFTFVVLILAAQPLGVLNAFTSDPTLLLNFDYIKMMFLINFNGIVSKSWTPVAINIVYALLTGIALTNMVAQLRILQVGSVSSIGGLIPGLFAAGCASCGPGLFALLGITGATIGFIPFQEIVLRFAGISMFLFFLGYSGDPRECRID
jgi:hypothetical protein